jgi:hypothetical protein
MTDTGASWPQTFFDWLGGEASAARAAASPQSALYEAAEFQPVREALYARVPVRPERLALSYFQRPAPVSLLIDEVEALWAPIAEADDWSALKAKTDHIEEARLALAL